MEGIRGLVVMDVPVDGPGWAFSLLVAHTERLKCIKNYNKVLDFKRKITGFPFLAVCQHKGSPVLQPLMFQA